jgi:hypothetical protein
MSYVSQYFDEAFNHLKRVPKQPLKSVSAILVARQEI